MEYDRLRRVLVILGIMAAIVLLGPYLGLNLVRDEPAVSKPQMTPVPTVEAIEDLLEPLAAKPTPRAAASQSQGDSQPDPQSLSDIEQMLQ